MDWLTRRRVQYSVGFGLTETIARIVDDLPDAAWTPAYNADGLVRDGAWVAELTAMVNLRSWPAGMRLIVRAERPHPGAQLRFTDSNGHRLTAFATNTRGGHSPHSSFGTAAEPAARTGSGQRRKPTLA